jgi:large subunit ribosomal protein L13
MKIVNAENLVLGRMASIVSEELLKGESIVIVNAEKAVITGSKESILKKFKTRIDLSPKGNPRKGPKFPKRPDGILRRSVRGMLPFKTQRGRNAFKRLKVFIGVPEELKGKEFVVLENAVKKMEKNFLTLGELSKSLDGKW